MKNYISRDLIFCAFTVFLVAVTALCVTGTVIGQSHIDEREVEAFYCAKEKEMVSEVIKYLNDNGFRNSGVALTRVVDGEGYREYMLTIHHDKIDVMSDRERDELKGRLSDLEFEDENCSFRQEFLILDK